MWISNTGFESARPIALCGVGDFATRTMWSATRRHWRFFRLRWIETCTAFSRKMRSRCGPDLSLTLGTKLEHNDYTGFEVEPNVRLSWTLSSKQALWAAVSRAVRTPSRIDQDLSEGSPPYFVLLKEARDFTSEIGDCLRTGLSRAARTRNFQPRSRAFYNHYNDIRSTSITPDDDPAAFLRQQSGGRHLRPGIQRQLSGHGRLVAACRLYPAERAPACEAGPDAISTRRSTRPPTRSISSRCALH